MLKILANLIILILLKEIYSDSDPKYLNLNLNLTIEKGETMTFLVPESYRTKNILVYCSLEDTMEVSYFTSDVKKQDFILYLQQNLKKKEHTKFYLKQKNKLTIFNPFLFPMTYKFNMVKETIHLNLNLVLLINI